jgi:hypothetical protein
MFNSGERELDCVSESAQARGGKLGGVMNLMLCFSTCVLALTSMIAVAAPQEGVAPAAMRHDQYAVDVYRGALHPPEGYVRDSDVGWRDDEGKAAEPPTVNFAGSYFVAAHSCGASCRYSTLTDMRTGKDYGVLGMFDSADPPAKTREGYPYVTELVTHANSRMFIARYHIDREGKALCRERTFVLQPDLKLTPVGDTRMTCGD